MATVLPDKRVVDLLPSGRCVTDQDRAADVGVELADRYATIEDNLGVVFKLPVTDYTNC